MTGKNQVKLVLLPVHEMKAALPANNLARQPAAEEFIEKNRATRDKHTEIPWATIVLSRVVRMFFAKPRLR